MVGSVHMDVHSAGFVDFPACLPDTAHTLLEFFHLIISELRRYHFHAIFRIGRSAIVPIVIPLCADTAIAHDAPLLALPIRHIPAIIIIIAALRRCFKIRSKCLCRFCSRAQNKSIGQFNLSGIAPARRGVPQIEVTFDIDANGILKVSAKDKATGKEQAIRIEASSGLSKEEIEKMKAEAEANAEADKKEREKIDKLNQADSVIFQTENQLKELGDKLPADKKAPIEAALQKLKDAHKAQDLAAIDTAMAEINTAFQAASAEMYAQGGAQGGAQAGPDMNGGAGQQDNSKHGDNVQDADFEEVK